MMLGQLSLVTAPTIWPVSVTEARAQSLYDSQDRDDWFQRAIKAATRYCEKNIPGGRQLTAATWDLPLTGFWDYPLQLSKPPLQSVSSVKYYDLDGVQQTASSSLYVVRTPETLPGEIELLPEQIWPVGFDERKYPVVVRFVAGYSSVAAIPDTIKHAILMLTDHWFQNRSSVVVGSISKEIDFAVTALLESEGWGAYA